MNKRIIYLIACLFLMLKCKSNVEKEHILLKRDVELYNSLEEEIDDIYNSSIFISVLHVMDETYDLKILKNKFRISNQIIEKYDIDKVEMIKKEYLILTEWINVNNYPLILNPNFDRMDFLIENSLNKEQLSNIFFDLKLNILKQEILIAQIKLDSLKYEAHYSYDSTNFNPFSHDYMVWCKE